MLLLTGGDGGGGGKKKMLENDPHTSCLLPIGIDCETKTCTDYSNACLLAPACCCTSHYNCYLLVSPECARETNRATDMHRHHQIIINDLINYSSVGSHRREIGKRADCECKHDDDTPQCGMAQQRNVFGHFGCSTCACVHCTTCQWQYRSRRHIKSMKWMVRI